MKEFLNSLLEVSKERIKNPFLGSFIFAWLVFNWKPILYLIFSDDIMSDRISTIECKYINIWDNLGFPFVFAILYIVILPYMMWGLEELYIKAKSGRLSNKLDEELLTIRNKQATTRESLKLENIKADFKETSELNDKINSLQLDNDDLLTKVNTKNEEISKLKNDYNNLKAKSFGPDEIEELDNAYKFFSNSKLFDFFKMIGVKVLFQTEIPKSNLPDYVIEKYEMEDIIYKTLARRGHAFTKKGDHFWKNYLNQEFINSYNEAPF
ncbi:hypothetical protein [Seonamhaeicola sp.]|uniref:hypothetical protein n=1 Tax=Seonamhaeicola sp. TaxID=1912245 RepID=UPI002604511C|nr:hypothetical protein [Seonamhaeicola sp.]